MNGMERRLVLRLLARWRAAAAGAPLATVESLAAQGLDDVGASLFLLRLRRDDEPLIERVGYALAAELPFPPAGHPVSAVPAHSLLGQAMSFHPQVIEKGVPVATGGTFIDSAGQSFLFRGIILPLDDGNGAIGYLVGAANAKADEGG